MLNVWNALLCQNRCELPAGSNEHEAIEVYSVVQSYLEGREAFVERKR